MPRRPIKLFTEYCTDEFAQSVLTRHTSAVIQCFLNKENPTPAIVALTPFLSFSNQLYAILFDSNSNTATEIIKNLTQKILNNNDENPIFHTALKLLVSALICRVLSREQNKNPDKQILIELSAFFKEKRNGSISQTIEKNLIDPIRNELQKAIDNDTLPTISTTQETNHETISKTSSILDNKQPSNRELIPYFKRIKNLCNASKFDEAFEIIQEISSSALPPNTTLFSFEAAREFFNTLANKIQENTNPNYVIFALQALTELLQPNEDECASDFLLWVDKSLIRKIITEFEPQNNAAAAALSNFVEILIKSHVAGPKDFALTRTGILAQKRITTIKTALSRFNAFKRSLLLLGIAGIISTGIAIGILLSHAVFFNPWMMLFIGASIAALGFIGFGAAKLWDYFTDFTNRHQSSLNKYEDHLAIIKPQNLPALSSRPFIENNLATWLKCYGIEINGHGDLIAILRQEGLRISSNIDPERDAAVFEHTCIDLNNLNELARVIKAQKTIALLLHQSDENFKKFLSKTSLKMIHDAQTDQPENQFYKNITISIIDKIFSDEEFAKLWFNSTWRLDYLFNTATPELSKKVVEHITSEKHRTCFKDCIISSRKDPVWFNSFLKNLNILIENGHINAQEAIRIKNAIWNTMHADKDLKKLLNSSNLEEIKEFYQTMTKASSSSKVVPSVFNSDDDDNRVTSSNDEEEEEEDKEEEQDYEEEKEEEEEEENSDDSDNSGPNCRPW